LHVTSLTVDAFVRKLATADPTPGGGSASAVAGAMAAALVRMVALLTAASPKHADVADRARAIAGQADNLVGQVLRCVDDDVTAFDGVTSAFKLPKSTDVEKRSRTDAIQAALLAAAGPPMRVVDSAVEICRLAAELVDFGNPNAVSDVGCAAMFAGAAAQGAAFNVAINVKSLKDRAAANTYDERLRSALAQADLLTEVVLGKVQAAVKASA
jgi:formiminotetrahydrofolate cyclodeaminase